MNRGEISFVHFFSISKCQYSIFFGSLHCIVFSLNLHSSPALLFLLNRASSLDLDARLPSQATRARQQDISLPFIHWKSQLQERRPSARLEVLLRQGNKDQLPGHPLLVVNSSLLLQAVLLWHLKVHKG